MSATPTPIRGKAFPTNAFRGAPHCEIGEIGLGALAGGVILGLGPRPLQELLHRGGFSEAQLRVDRERVKTREDNTLKKVVDVSLENPRKIVALVHIDFAG